jgi:membrane protease YdiL (CAAX protease family)
MISRNREFGSFNLIIVLLLIAAFMIGLFYLVKGLYTLMLYIAPILAISILFIDYRSYIALGRWIKRKYQKDVLTGITWTLICAAGFPFVLFILLYRAVFLKGIRSSGDNQRRPFNSNKEYLDYQDYEIIDEETN